MSNQNSCRQPLAADEAGVLDDLAPYGSTDAQAWRGWADSLIASEELGLECTYIEPGLARLVVTESKMTVNPNGASHGGLVAAAIDQAMGIVAVTVMDDRMICVTSTLNIRYYCPSYFPLHLEARVVRNGRAVVFVDVEVTGSDNVICAGGQGTMVPRMRVRSQ